MNDQRANYLFFRQMALSQLIMPHASFVLKTQV